MTMRYGPNGILRSLERKPQRLPGGRGNHLVEDTADRAMAMRLVAERLGLPVAGLGYGQNLDDLSRAADWRCFLCGLDLVALRGITPNHGHRMTAEHVWPKVRGGTRHRNILPAHKKCNGRKGDRLPYPCELLFLAAVTLRVEADRG